MTDPQTVLDAVQAREQEIVTHIDELIRLAGLDRSESATEAFSELLIIAGTKALRESDQPYNDGLCYDCRWIIAREIMNSRVVKEWKKITLGGKK